MSNEVYLIVLASVFVFAFFCFIMSVILFNIIWKRISHKTFHYLFTKILGKLITYFDITPLGQILNLNSKDMGMVDYLISLFSYMILLILFYFINTLIFISINIVVLIPLILVYGYFCISMMKDYFISSI